MNKLINFIVFLMALVSCTIMGIFIIVVAYIFALEIIHWITRVILSVG
jgi:hypothetical protein